MISIIINQEETFDFDTSDLPHGEEFAALLDFFNENNVSQEDQVRVSEAYNKWGYTKESYLILRNAQKSGYFTNGKSPLGIYLLSIVTRLCFSNSSYLNEATTLFREIETNDAFQNILKAFLLLLKGKYDTSLFLFKNSPHPLSSIGVSLTQFYTNEFDKSIKSVNLVVRGMSMYKKGMISEAVECFKKSGCQNANVYLYRLEGGAVEETRPDNLDVLITKAEKYINEEMYSEATEILKKMEKSKAEKNVLYLLGKIYHIMKDYSRAKEYYLRSGSELSRYGLMRIDEKIEDISISSSESKRVRNYILFKKGGIDEINTEEMTGGFRDVLEARIGEDRWGGYALKGYLKLRGCEMVEECVILSNIGYYIAKCREEVGEEETLRIIQSLEDVVSEGEKTQHTTSLAFALSSINEALRICPERFTDLLKYNLSFFLDAPSAISLIESLENRKPEYTIRLGILTNSLEQYKESTLCDNEIPGLTMIGYYYYSNRNISLAKKTFERILEKEDNLFSLLSLGNIYLYYYRKEKGKREEFLNRSMNYFRKSVMRYKGCWYGAMGIGICLADKGMYEEAKRIFSDIVKDIRCKNGYINLGIVHIKMGEYEEAFKSLLMGLGAGIDEKIFETLVGICKILNEIEYVEIVLKRATNESLRKDLTYLKCKILVKEGRLDQVECIAKELRDDKYTEVQREAEERRKRDEEERIKMEKRMEELKEYRGSKRRKAG
jgi:tetratricopeptide (TPR) repeat protein